MMVRLVFLLLLVASSYSIALGAAPTDVELKYDAEKKLFHIQANHPTDRTHRNFVRRVVVIVNSKVLQETYYTHQNSPVIFEDLFGIAFEPADHVEVELYSSEGGMGSGSIDIPKPDPDDKDKK